MYRAKRAVRKNNRVRHAMDNKKQKTNRATGLQVHTVGGHFGVGVCGVVEDAAELLVLGGVLHEEELGVVVRQAVSAAELKTKRRKKWGGVKMNEKNEEHPAIHRACVLVHGTAK